MELNHLRPAPKHHTQHRITTTMAHYDTPRRAALPCIIGLPDDKAIPRLSIMYICGYKPINVVIFGCRAQMAQFHWFFSPVWPTYPESYWYTMVLAPTSKLGSSVFSHRSFWTFNTNCYYVYSLYNSTLTHVPHIIPLIAAFHSKSGNSSSRYSDVNMAVVTQSWSRYHMVNSAGGNWRWRNETADVDYSLSTRLWS